MVLHELFARYFELFCIILIKIIWISSIRWKKDNQLTSHTNTSVCFSTFSAGKLKPSEDDCRKCLHNKAQITLRSFCKVDAWMTKVWAAAKWFSSYYCLHEVGGFVICHQTSKQEEGITSVKEAKDGSHAAGSICCSKLYQIKVLLVVLTHCRRMRKRKKKKKRRRNKKEEEKETSSERRKPP